MSIDLYICHKYFLYIYICSIFLHFRKEKAIELGQQDIDSGEKRRKNDFDTSNMNEYLLGSRKLKIFPVSMSLVGR